MRTFIAVLSQVDPADNVTTREFHQFDGAKNELVYILDPSAITVAGTLDETLGTGSCYLIDVNSVGPSGPSPAVALDPTVVPPPPPPPNGVPKTPTVQSIEWQDQ